MKSLAHSQLSKCSVAILVFAKLDASHVAFLIKQHIKHSVAVSAVQSDSHVLHIPVPGVNCKPVKVKQEISKPVVVLVLGFSKPINKQSVH